LIPHRQTDKLVSLLLRKNVALMSAGQKSVCSLFYSILLPEACEFFRSFHALSHSHPASCNMEPCRACEEKRICHTETDAKKHCCNKTEPSPQTVLWHPQNRNTHTKRKTRKIRGNQKQKIKSTDITGNLGALWIYRRQLKNENAAQTIK
jgi:hypothetical protein